MMKNIKVDNHQFISRLIYANNALFLQKWDAPIVGLLTATGLGLVSRRLKQNSNLN